MKLPKSFDDLSILEEEPLKTQFEYRKFTHSSRNTSKSQESFQSTPSIARLLRKEPGGLDAVREWAWLTFDLKNYGGALVGTERFDQLFSEYFVDFFWHLCAGQDEAALIYLKDLDRIFSGGWLPKRKISRPRKRSYRASAPERAPADHQEGSENANDVVAHIPRTPVAQMNGAPDVVPWEPRFSTPNLSAFTMVVSNGPSKAPTGGVPHMHPVTAHDSRERRKGDAQSQDVSGLSGRKRPKIAERGQSDSMGSSSEMRLVNETCFGPPSNLHGMVTFSSRPHVHSPEASAVAQSVPHAPTPSAGQNIGNILSHKPSADSWSITRNQGTITTPSDKRSRTYSVGSAIPSLARPDINSGNAKQSVAFVLPMTQPFGVSQNSNQSACMGHREMPQLIGPCSHMPDQLETSPYQRGFPPYETLVASPSIPPSHTGNFEPGADSKPKLKKREPVNTGQNPTLLFVPPQYPDVGRNGGPSGQPILPGCSRGMPQIGDVRSSADDGRVIAGPSYQSYLPLNAASFPIQSAVTGSPKTSTAEYLLNDNFLGWPQKDGVRTHEFIIDSIPAAKKKKTTSPSSKVRKARSLNVDVNPPIQSKDLMQVWRNGERSPVKSAKSSPTKKSFLADNWIDESLDSSEDPFDMDDLAEIDNDPFWPDPGTQVRLEAASFPRPPLRNLPPIWAQSRQEICETFEWFRSYQSGVYHVNGLVKGYLLSAFGSSRDVLRHRGKLIISHGGGKAQSIHCHNGELSTHQATDQLSQDKSVRALLNNYHQSMPLVLLMDDRYALFPYDIKALGVSYTVLGVYKITNAWAELHVAQNDRGWVVRYKFCFQWFEEKDPWWFAEDNEQPKTANVVLPTPPTSPSKSSSSPFYPIPVKRETIVLQPPKPINSYACGSCMNESRHVYEQGWMCLNPDCEAFWRTRDGLTPPETLTYTPEFLELLPISRTMVSKVDIRPPDPPDLNNLYTTHYACTRGLHCKRCGRLSSRYKWEHWECANCGSTYEVKGIIRTAKDFFHLRPSVNFLQSYCAKTSGIEKFPCQTYRLGAGGSHSQTFELPDQRGRIHVIYGAPLINGIPDEIFQLYQEDAAVGRLRFRRWPLRSHKLRGQFLTNYFSQNTGEPYHYVGGTDNTVPFSESSRAVVMARNFIQERAKVALNLDLSFNEVLTAAYMEKQRMAFHSDAEKGLGPNIGSLSLGAPALMHFRLHPRYDENKDFKGNALTLALRHGDVVVMEGSSVQKFYEHTVVPANFRIAATARLIDPSHY